MGARAELQKETLPVAQVRRLFLPAQGASERTLSRQNKSAEIGLRQSDRNYAQAPGFRSARKRGRASTAHLERSSMLGSGAHTPPTCPPLPASAPDRRSSPRATWPPGNSCRQEIVRGCGGNIPPPDRDPGSPNSSFPLQTIHPRPRGSGENASPIDRSRRAFAVRDFASDTPAKLQTCVPRRARDRSAKRR